MQCPPLTQWQVTCHGLLPACLSHRGLHSLRVNFVNEGSNMAYRELPVAQISPAIALPPLYSAQVYSLLLNFTTFNIYKKW